MVAAKSSRVNRQYKKKYRIRGTGGSTGVASGAAATSRSG